MHYVQLTQINEVLFGILLTDRLPHKMRKKLNIAKLTFQISCLNSILQQACSRRSSSETKHNNERNKVAEKGKNRARIGPGLIKNAFFT